MLKRFDNPYLLLILTTLFWSGNMITGRGVRADIPPMALAFWRWLITLSLALPFALPYLRSQWPIIRQHWHVFVLLGLLGVGGYNTFAYIALQYTTATNAGLLNSFIPVVTAVISWLFLHKSLRPIEGLGVAISFCGALTIIGHGDPQILIDLKLNQGDAWMLLAVLCWALYTIGLGWLPPGVHPMLILTVLTSVGLVATGIGYGWELARGLSMNLHAHSLGALLYVGIFPGLLSYIFYNRAVAQIGASKASLFIHLMPVFVTLLSTLLLNEGALWYHYTGMALIFGGIWLTTRK